MPTARCHGQSDAAFEGPMNRQPATASPSVVAAGLLAVLLPAAQAFAAQPAGHASGMGGSAEGLFVAEIVLLLLVGRGLGEIFQRYRQPALMGQLIGGILLGPSLFGWLWPDVQHLIFSADPAQKSMIDAVSQLGI